VRPWRLRAWRQSSSASSFTDRSQRFQVAGFQVRCGFQVLGGGGGGAGGGGGGAYDETVSAFSFAPAAIGHLDIDGLLDEGTPPAKKTLQTRSAKLEKPVRQLMTLKAELQKFGVIAGPRRSLEELVEYDGGRRVAVRLDHECGRGPVAAHWAPQMRARTTIRDFIVTHDCSPASAVAPAAVLRPMKAGSRATSADFFDVESQPGPGHLLRRVASTDTPPGERLYWAAMHGLNDEVASLLRQGTPPDSFRSHGRARTALHAAAIYGQVGAGAQLLDHGGAADAITAPARETPLALAAARGHAEFCELLLSRGADPAVCDFVGRTALDCLHNVAAPIDAELLRELTQRQSPLPLFGARQRLALARALDAPLADDPIVCVAESLEDGGALRRSRAFSRFRREQAQRRREQQERKRRKTRAKNQNRRQRLRASNERYALATERHRVLLSWLPSAAAALVLVLAVALQFAN